MFRRFFRHIREGFIGIRRHFAMALSSASAVLLTLGMVGVFVILVGNLSYLAKEIEQSISLVALVDYETVDSSQILKIKEKIINLEGVEEVEYRSKDEEFDYYNEQYPDMVEFSELYRDDNPFHDAFIITLADGSDMATIKENIGNLSGISSVEDGGANTYTLINILREARIIGAALVLALVLLATYLIYNTIKVTIATRADEIIIMRNVGAKNSYIRAPFLVEGIIIGIMGSLIPIALLIYAYYRLYVLCDGVLAGVITLIPVFPFVLYLGLALLIIGVLVGYIGSYISVCRYLRLTR